jgi:hypothetical protein
MLEATEEGLCRFVLFCTEVVLELVRGCGHA